MVTKWGGPFLLGVNLPAPSSLAGRGRPIGARTAYYEQDYEASRGCFRLVTGSAPTFPNAATPQQIGEPMGVSQRTFRELTLLGSPKDARAVRASHRLRI